MTDPENAIVVQNKKIKEGTEAIRQVIAEHQLSDVFVLPTILGTIAHENFFDSTNSFLNNGLQWLVAKTAADEMRVMTPNILKLCEWLSINEHTCKNPFNDYDDDEYTALMVNTPECVVLLGVTDAFSYIVSIHMNHSKVPVFNDGNIEIQDTTLHQINIRYLPDAKVGSKLPAKKKNIKNWKWLTDLEGLNKHSILHYKDERDDGYLLSVKETLDFDGTSWKSESALENYPLLCKVITNLLQLFAATDCLNESV